MYSLKSHAPEPHSQALLLDNSTHDMHAIRWASETNEPKWKEAAIAQLRHRDKEGIFITAHARAIAQAQLSNGNVSKRTPSQPACGQHPRQAYPSAMIAFWLRFS